MKINKRLLLVAAMATAGPAGLMSLSAAAQDDVEEIIVTGSHIKGTPENAELPVDVLRRADLEELGSPTLLEMVRNLGVSSGNIGETNQFQAGGQANEGVATVNLRGLGSARTLVLFNGRRHVPTNFVGTDLNFIPTNAIGRVEVLKDGAAALYGSDAIAGVVNFITRSNFEGLEVNGSHQFIDGSSGDSEFGVIWGASRDNVSVMLAAEYKRRSKLQVRDRDWALRPFAETPQGGWSSIGNPGSALSLATFAWAADPQCEALGGEIGAPFCRFQYSYWDNLIEDEEHLSIYGEVNFQLANGAEFYMEGGYAEVELEPWNSSPSYPPQTLTGADRYVFPGHPGWDKMFADNFAYYTGLGFAAGPQPVIAWNRAAGIAGLDGKPQEGYRKTEQTRFVAGLDGAMYNDAIDYSVSLAWSKRDRYIEGEDTYVERMGLALKGLGGAGCDTALGVPGVGACEWYNPFSNSIAVSPITGFANPQYDPAVANSPEMMDWLFDRLGTATENELLVLDAVISGMTGWQFGGGEAAWALGGQFRAEEYSSTPNAINNLSLNPCPWNDPQSVALGLVGSLDCTGSETGFFAFLAGSDPESDDRNVWGLFGELALPITDTLDMQLALRYEDYGGQTGSTTDPKIAVHWQINDALAMRASASSTFRGPALASLSGRGTALQFIAPTTAFKAVDTVGHPGLQAEKAIALNVGFLMDVGNFSGSIDWWSFDFEDRIGVESANQIVSAYANFNAVTNPSGLDCADGEVGEFTPECAAIRAHIFPTGTAAGGIQRIDVSWYNSGDVETSGIDFQGQLEFDLENATLTVGAEGTHVIEFVSDDFKDVGGVLLAPGGDFVGQLNESNPFTPLPQLKASIFATYDRGQHNVRYVMRYVDDYTDEIPPAGFPQFASIDSMVTHDIHYNYAWTEQTRLNFSVFNALDEDPPFASLDLNYDPFTHSAFGRMFKIGVTHTFY